MGFGTIIAGIYFVAVLIVSGYVVTDTVNRMSNTSYESVLTASSIELEKLRSSASISGILIGDEHGEIYVNITNTGEVRIVSADFLQIDIILTYTDNSTRLTQTHWCYYDSNDPSQYRWLLNSTFSPNPFPAMVNPLDWDPSKTLSITIELAEPHHIMPGSVGYLKVVLPEGSSTAQTFTG
jgi:hypothetical protein